jgi:hypothetical protein
MNTHIYIVLIKKEGTSSLHTTINLRNPALLVSEGFNKAQNMEQESKWKSNHNYQKQITISQFIFKLKWSQMIYNFIATNQQTFET